MNMKNNALLLTAILLLSAAYAVSQDMPAPHNEEHWKELQSMRVWVIIQHLNLDASSERGLAILNVINKNAESNRELLLQKHQKMRELHTLMQKDNEEDSGIVTLIEEIEKLHRDILQGQLQYQTDLQSLLNPNERAKLLIAESVFQQRLRRAIQGRGRIRRSHGPGEKESPGREFPLPRY